MIEIQSSNETRTIGEILADNGLDKNGRSLSGVASDDGAGNIKVEPVTVGPKMVIDPARAKIESGIAMPAAKQFKKGSSWLPLLNKMQIGDSAFFAGATLAQLNYVRLIGKKHGLHVSMRARDNGVRMWRVPEDKPLQTDPPKAPVSDDDGLGA